MIVKALVESRKLLLKEIVYTIRHKIGLLKSLRYSNQNKLKLNLGSGDINKKGWINIDIDSIKADITLDLRKKLPFKNGSCSEIYSEHFLEHLEYPNESNNFLSEAYRVLENGGILTIGVPDTEWPLREYLKKNKNTYFLLSKSKKWHPKWYTTKIEHINFHFRQGSEHKFAYDFELLTKILKNLKLVNIHKRKFNPKIDSKFHNPGTLYVEGTKK